MPENFILGIISLILLFCLGAFFSGVETALISLSRLKTKMLMSKFPKKAKGLNAWLSNPNELLTTLLIGINAVAVASATLSAVIAYTLAETYHLSKVVLNFISGLTVTIIIIVFGEIVPKIFAIHNAEYVTLHTITPLYYLNKVITPFTNFFAKLATFIIKMLGGKASNTSPLISRDEIKALVSLGNSEGILKSDEGTMLHNVFKFNEKIVKDVMVTQGNMICVNASDTINHILKLAAEEGYTRMPVYKDNKDNIIGILHTKELLNIWINKKLFILSDLLRSPYFVSDNKKVTDLLTELKKNKIHMAIVKNNENKTIGLVTLEDLLEEIVGEMSDEFDIPRN